MSKELEALINIGAIFVSCISNEDGDIDYCHLRNHNEYSNWYSTVEKALKRTEPMKVIFTRFTNALTEDFWDVPTCPICKSLVIDEDKFCHECGKALDWSDEK